MLRVGVIGAGWPGAAHVKGYLGAGGFKVVAISDLIPDRRRKLMADAGAAKEYAEAADLIADKEIDVVSVCLPNGQHAATAVAALRAGKHVMCEKPPAISVKEAKQMAAAAQKSGKVLMYGVQRRFGGAELASKQAIEKGHVGEVYHARASWLRTRGIPRGTGWFTDKSKSGGGAMIDIGVHMLDLAWHLMGQPKPVGIFGVTHRRFGSQLPAGVTFDVEDSGFALVRFEGGKSLEVAASWALNQPPNQQGTVCRVFGDRGAVDVYTPEGAVVYRKFGVKGETKGTALKGPKVTGHPALMRAFREAIGGKAGTGARGEEGVSLMRMLEGIYKSAEEEKSVKVGD